MFTGSQRKGLIETRDQTQGQVEAAIGAVDEARKSYETAQQNQSQANVQILSTERSVQDAEQKLTNLQTEKTTLEQQVRSADERIAQLEADLGSQRKTFEKEQEQKSVAERSRENARSHEEDAAEKLNELRLAVATERQRHESLVNHRQPMAAREAELADLVAARRGDIVTYQNRLTAQAKESEESEASILKQKARNGCGGTSGCRARGTNEEHPACIRKRTGRPGARSCAIR